MIPQNISSELRLLSSVNHPLVCNVLSKIVKSYQCRKWQLILFERACIYYYCTLIFSYTVITSLVVIFVLQLMQERIMNGHLGSIKIYPHHYHHSTRIER